MGGQKVDADIASHLEAISENCYRRQKIQQGISDLIQNAALSAESNKNLLKDLQKLDIAFNDYNQYIDIHVEKIMSCIEKSPLVEKAIERRKSDNKSLIQTYMPKKQEFASEGFTKASNFKKSE
ncbi:MAG: hypothetical protein CVV30_11385 [Methanomicrobiales archaeon HGW-Methanomicrobiales-1]|jgi:hypothetical protein|nr:MAG: hypothetical protein CVV30_11385 [Methanomicrobiales archaeon HGW-Methanomicrobiales-1]